MFCKNCGKYNTNSNVNCEHCGKPLKEEQKKRPTNSEYESRMKLGLIAGAIYSLIYIFNWILVLVVGIIGFVLGVTLFKDYSRKTFLKGWVIGLLLSIPLYFVFYLIHLIIIAL